MDVHAPRSLCFIPGSGAAVVRPLRVLKFGGTSVGSVDRLRCVVEIVKRTSQASRVVVVASALGGVTDLLVAAFDEGANAASVAVLIEKLDVRHQQIAGELLGSEAQAGYAAALRARLDNLRESLNQARAEGQTSKLRDEVLAAGERLSVPLVAGLLSTQGLDASPIDASTLVRTDAGHGNAAVDLAATYRQIQAWHQNLPATTIPVVTGFVGATAAGATTTLGRGGSDYSAALFASALSASALERWTDVDGLYTDDPRRNEHAERLGEIVLEKAWAWNHAGRLGMHRKALDPLVAAGIPVYVRSTYNPDAPGTAILPSGYTALAS